MKQIFILLEYDGLFLSNGPGDPSLCEAAITILRKVIKDQPDVPIFGICMGHQILSLAAGCSSYKMKYEDFFSNLFYFVLNYLQIKF